MSFYNDLFGGESVPPPRAKRIVSHQPVENTLVLFNTIGTAEREGFPPDAPGAETARQAQHRTHAVPDPSRSRTRRAPHVRGSATSQAAAEAITPKLTGKRLVVLREICAHFTADGFTDNELIQHMAQAYGWNQNTPRARRIELVGDGWVASTETTRNKSTVWMPTEAAVRWYRQENQGQEK